MHHFLFLPFIGFLFNLILIDVAVFHNNIIGLVGDIHVLNHFFGLLFQDLHLGGLFRHYGDVLLALKALGTAWTLHQLTGLLVALVARGLHRALFLVAFLAFDGLAAVRKLRPFLFVDDLPVAFDPD